MVNYNSNRIHVGEFSYSVLKKILPGISEQISWFSIGLVKIQIVGNREVLNLLGSGTLIQVNENYGILTATHVTKELLSSDKFRIGLSGSGFSDILPLEMQYLSPINIDVNGTLFGVEVPDISFITLPDNIVGTIKAKKSFYNFLNKQPSHLLDNEFDLSETFILFGTPDEFTKEKIDNEKFIIIKQYESLCGFAKIIDYFNYNEFDFIKITGIYKNESAPESFGGFSGGGLWSLIVNIKGDKDISIEDIFLVGVPFFQTSKENNERYLICHGPHSLYKQLANIILKKVNTN